MEFKKNVLRIDTNIKKDKIGQNCAELQPTIYNIISLLYPQLVQTKRSIDVLSPTSSKIRKTVILDEF